MNIEELIKSLAGTLGKDLAVLVSAEVLEVRESDRVCKIRTIGGDNETEISDVALMAESNDGFYRVPKVGSIVKVSLSQNENPVVLVFGEIQKIFIEAELIETNGGEFGGLTKTLELQQQLYKMQAQLDACVTSLRDWTVVSSDGGAALKSFFATQIFGRPRSNFDNIENTKFKHGS